MSRDMKLYELRKLVLAYMSIEDIAKAAEAMERWKQAVKEFGDDI